MLFRSDGTVIDERRFCVLGGDMERVNATLSDGLPESLDLAGALRLAVGALAGPDRQIPVSELEVAILSRSNGRRCFRRLDDSQVAVLLGSETNE